MATRPDRGTDVLFDGAVVIVTSISAVALYAGSWFVLGLARRIRRRLSETRSG
jgi:hypothetical protein